MYKGLIKKLRLALTEELKQPQYKGKANMAGHCYVASEALYHMLGGKEAGWKPMYIEHEGMPHWFLMNNTGYVLDVTADQFSSPVPINKAIGKGFLTKLPSKRAQIVIKRVSGASYD